MDNKLKIALAFPFLLAVMVYFIGGGISYNLALTPQERQILNFVPENLELPEVKSLLEREKINSPIEIHGQVFPSNLIKVTSGAKLDNKVTLIVIGNYRKIAMIDGVLVREGESVGNLVVKSIESNRVLVKRLALDNKENANPILQWLYLEEKQ
jgi:hypothetical protein